MHKYASMLLLCLLLTACAARTISPRGGLYRMSAPPETVSAPSLSLDAEAKTFMFSYDPLSSYLPVGTFSQEDDVLLCRSDDELYLYAFRIVNETTLAFIQQESADVTLIDDRVGEQVTDGSVFLLVADP